MMSTSRGRCIVVCFRCHFSHEQYSTIERDASKNINRNGVDTARPKVAREAVPSEMERACFITETAC
jgi:hypothetical protein